MNRPCFPLRAAGWLCLSLALAGCRWLRPAEAPAPIQQRISWCGRMAASAEDSVPSDTAAPQACIRILRMEFPGTESPFRVELRRYRKARWAFEAWQALSAGSPSQDGCARTGSRWAFIHGDWVGLTDSSAAHLYPEEFKERLAFAGEPVFGLPSEFGAFPLRGRLPGSERIFPRDFLGGPWKGPIYSVAYRCHGDTAWAFRGSAQNPDFLRAYAAGWKGKPEDRKSGKPGKGWGFEGKDEFGRPILVDVFSTGILGISGCYDREWVRDFAEKLRKTQVFWRDP